MNLPTPLAETTRRGQGEIRLWTIIRAFAALWVVLFHFKAHIAFPLTSLPLIGRPIASGNIGVDLFFVLSGLVMGLVYGLARKSDGFRYGDFLMKRFSRIYPVHLVTLIGALLMLVVGYSFSLASVDPATVLRALPLQVLLLHGVGIGGADSLNYPSWSVSAEMLAYLCFPLLAGLVHALRSRPVVALAVSIGAVLIADGSGVMVSSPAVRVLVDFTFGLACSRFLGCDIAAGLGWILFLASVALTFGLIAVGVSEGPIVLGFGGILLGAYYADPALTSGPMTSALLFLGRISYSIYMVHALIEAPGFLIAQRLTGSSHNQNPTWVLIPLFLMVGLAATACYYVVEQPGRRWILRRWRERAGFQQD